MKLIYLYTSITWYRLNLFKEISKLCDCKFVIIDGFDYSKTSYKNIKFNPDFGDLDITFLSKEESTYASLCKYLDNLEFDSIVVPSMNGKRRMDLTIKLSKYYSNKGKNILYFWEYWPLEDTQSDLKRKIIQCAKNMYVKRASKYIDYFITPSNYTLAYYLRLNIPSRKIIKVFNVSTFNEIKPYDVRSEYGLPQNSKIILYLGRLEKYKGVNELVSAFEKCQFEDTYLFLCGDGSINKDVFADCKNVICTGSIEYSQTYKYFSSADIFVLPNNYNGKIEAWGLTVNEAMAYSLPVIATNGTGASYDLIYNNVNGYVLDANRMEEQLIFALTELVNNEKKRIRFGLNSKKIVDNFTFENMAAGFVYCANQIKK